MPYRSSNHARAFSLSWLLAGFLPVAAIAAETLPNGITLPDQWPPTVKIDGGQPVAVPYLQSPPKVIPIDVGRQLFVDDFLIESTTLTRVWHSPEKHPGNPILKPETPLELENNLCPMAAPFSDGAFYDAKDRLFKLWYHAGWFDGTALAIGHDGLSWQRPALDVVPGTNRLIPDRDQMRRDGMSIWLDHDAAKEAERYKMLLFTRYGAVGGSLKGGTGHLLTSPDGVHWDFRGATGPCGDNTTMFYNPFRKKWVFSIRSSSKASRRTARMRSYWECSDFVESEKWGTQQPVPWAGTDELDLPDPAIGDLPQLYKVDAVAYESLMLGLFEILYGPDNGKCAAAGTPKLTELQTAFSRDGFHWDRSHRESFITASRKPGDWERGYITSTGGCCLIVGDKLHFYYGAFQGNEEHKGGNGQWSGMYANASTGLAILRRDGFASMDAAQQEGTLTTRPVSFQGRHLFVNVAAAGGELSAEVIDEKNQVVEPFSRKNSVPAATEGTKVAMTWKDGSDLSTLAGKTVRIRFHLKQGALYAFWVSPDQTGASHGYVAAGGPGFTSAIDTTGR